VLALQAVARNLHGVSLRAQGALDEVRDATLVLDQKDAHPAIVRGVHGGSVRELSRDP
jgi:hypothetical protein